MRNTITTTYQPPMGKVKEERAKIISHIRGVYQSPMGKVKNNILCSGLIINHRY